MRTLAIFLITTSLAFATDKEPPKTQSQEQAQHQGQDQSQTSTSAAAQEQSSAANLTQRDELQAPSINAPAVYASHPCSVGWSAGLSIPGGGIGGGHVKPDPSCDRRELARVIAALNPALALRILCADPIAAAVATAEDCVYVAPKPPEPRCIECITPSALIERDRRMLEKTGQK